MIFFFFNYWTMTHHNNNNCYLYNLFIFGLKKGNKEICFVYIYIYNPPK